MTPPCKLCGGEITTDNPDDIYKEVTSWVTGIKLQNPVLRTQTGEMAHRTCVEKMISGQAPDQESLPGLTRD